MYWNINDRGNSITLFSTVLKSDLLKLTSECFLLSHQFQLTDLLIWVFEFTIFSTELKKHKYIWNKIEEIRFADIDFFYLSSFIFKENHVLIEEDNPS